VGHTRNYDPDARVSMFRSRDTFRCQQLQSRASRPALASAAAHLFNFDSVFIENIKESDALQDLMYCYILTKSIRFCHCLPCTGLHPNFFSFRGGLLSPLPDPFLPCHLDLSTSLASRPVSLAKHTKCIHIAAALSPPRFTTKRDIKSP
jgi:hypothetical protein